MRYEFPVIHSIDDIERFRAEGLIHKSFGRWARDNGTIVYDYTYMTDDVFPRIGENAFAPYARELRGLTFDAETGALLSRPYHKFFNAGEREETLPQNLDFGAAHAVLEKLDGSMIHVFLAPGGNLAFATRSGVTAFSDAAFDWFKDADASGAGRTAVRRLCEDGYTPIFEWTSPSNIVVIEHVEPRLTLTAVRHRESGRYLDMPDLLHHARSMRVAAVGSFDPVAEWPSFAERVFGETDGEGYVLRFADGHMLKVKNARYARIHKLKSRLVQEKDVVELALGGGLDDILPHLPEAERAALSAYRDALMDAIGRVARRVEETVAAGRLALGAEDARLGQKRFWLEHATPLGADLAGVAMLVWNARESALDAVSGLVAKNTGTGPRFDALANRLGLPRWGYSFAGDL